MLMVRPQGFVMRITCCYAFVVVVLQVKPTTMRGVCMSLLILFVTIVGDGGVKGTTVDQSDCYDDWYALKEDMEQGSAGTFRICPGTTFELDETRDNHWIHLDHHNNNDRHQAQKDHKNLTLQCGDHGRVEDECVIHGGLHHVRMIHNHDTARHIAIRGVTFEGARYGSVWHVNVHHVTYENCQWRDNRHVAATVLYDVYDDGSGGGGAALNGYQANLFLLNSTFVVRCCAIQSTGNRYTIVTYVCCHGRENTPTHPDLGYISATTDRGVPSAWVSRMRVLTSAPFGRMWPLKSILHGDIQ